MPTTLDTLIMLMNYFFLKLQTRVAAIFVFVSFCSLLSIARVPALIKEIKVTFMSV